MKVSEECWRVRLSRLVEQLGRNGSLCSPVWRAAFEETPRHTFVPTVIRPGESSAKVLSGDDPAQQQSWLDLVYSDTSLVTKCIAHPSLTTADGEPLQVSTSSSTMPSLMARMLEALDVHDGHRVLEIGTGTGYNAALLCHRLGSTNVVSIDVDPDLVAAAEEQLAGLDYHPTLIVGDGSAGFDGKAPYDRIISTAAVPDIPLPWIEQLAPGGRILANLRGDLAGGTLCLLTKHDDDDEVIGRVLPLGGHFMWLRPRADCPLRAPEPAHVRSSRRAARTSTALDASPLVDNDSFRFVLQLHLHDARGFRSAQVYDPRSRMKRDGVFVEARDGSYAEIITDRDLDGQYPVVQAGPRRLWDSVEAAHRLWQQLGQPEPDRFGVVVNPTTQFVWFETDEGWYRWPLPLACAVLCD